MKALKLVSKILVIVFAFLFGVIFVCGGWAKEHINEITAYLGQPSYEIIGNAGDDYEEEDTIYYDSDFTSIAELKAAGEEIAEEVSLEGSALLKNGDVGGKPALPLSEGDTVNFYSMSSYDPIYNGTGDQGRAYMNLEYTETHMLDAFTEAGFKVNKDLFDWYRKNYNTYGRKDSDKTLRAWGNAIYKHYTIADASWENIGTAAKENAAEAGIFILSRVAGEGSDTTTHDVGWNPGDMTNGNYLALSPTEISVLTNMKRMKDEGKLKKIIVVLNFSNQVECKFIDEEKYGVDAAIWVGNFGMRGPEALAKMLLGDVNPSGKLVDTFWKEHCYNPVLTNFGEVSKGNTFSFTNGAQGADTDRYVVYQEGIYVGYRYTETRYEDLILGTANVGEFNYSDAVSYPFGYGISYTNFEYSNFTVKENSMSNPKTYDLSVTVINNGDVSGKEAVQFYLQKPYTQYDKDNNVEKAAVEIVGYAKTDELEPGASQTVTYTVDQSYFASYDAYKARTYIMDPGSYYFTAAPDAHTAVNNILLKKLGEDARSRSGWVEMPHRESSSALVNEIKISTPGNQPDAKTFSKSKYTGAEITNRFDDVDILTYDGAGDSNKANMTYMTRDDWNGTVHYAWSDYASGTWANNEVKLSSNAKMAEDSKLPVLQKDNIEYPTMEADNGLSLIDLQSDLIPYNDELWEKLLDQMSWEEMCNLIGNGHGGTIAVESINKVATYDMDSAVGVDQVFGQRGAMQSFATHYNDPDKGKKSTSYPGNDTVAATYNDDLIYRMGVQWGEDCLWVGYTCLYGPGVNLHRTPYGGRNYNYFSEDGFMTGHPAGVMIKGMKTKGAENLIKHVGLNEQETNRIGGTTWANEQSIREVYLRGAEIAIGEFECQGVMASLARMGMKYCGHQGYFKYVIRDEFGATGYNVSDSFMGYMSPSYCVLMGQGLPLSSAPGDLLNKEEGYGEFAWALREECHRVLYTVVHSNGMNFQAPGMQVKRITPPWLAQLNALTTVMMVLFILSAVFAAVMVVLGYLPATKDKFKVKDKKAE